ncbi:rubrerythrin family protein [Floridanema evergladense]|uniref:Rubrerythrin family protein n=1 Tax=Floridaenema evergladense BLCC-F167 TaxID=3153639 RepID=A0ABV4WMX6_9CYAN
MKPAVGMRQIAKKFSILFSATTLGIISLTSCTSPPPSAVVEPTKETTQPQVTQVANNAQESATLKNLQAAYNGESNAHVRYLAFAKKADEEGYGKVASLFRAAARAEEIHSEHHAKVIKKMGATPTNKIETPVVKSTSENLQEAIKGESYERDTMYPEFIKQAEKENNKDAVRTLEFARNAEEGHAKYYTEALNNLTAWKGGTKTFYVCPDCGLTVAVIDFKNCPECGEPQNLFLKIV